MIPLHVANDLTATGEGVGRREPLKINTEETYPLSAFCIPEHYRQDLQHVLLPNGLLMDRIEKLALDIREFYGDVELHVVCILKGSRGFFTAMFKFLSKLSIYAQTQENPPFLEHYCRILPRKEDGDDQDITIVSEDLSTLRGKNVLVIEDLINTGQTLGVFCKKVKAFEPNSLKVASLLEKENAKFKGDFVGFSVPEDFLVGFSLDHEERYRDLDHICVLSETGRKRSSKVEKDSSPKSLKVTA